jgi:hypothetical protein
VQLLYQCTNICGSSMLRQAACTPTCWSPLTTDSNKKLGAERWSSFTRHRYASTGVRWSLRMRWERGIRLAPLPAASRKAAAALPSLRVPSSAASSSAHVHAPSRSEGLRPDLDYMMAVGSAVDCSRVSAGHAHVMPNPPCDGTGVALEATACARAAAARRDRLLLDRRLVLWQGIVPCAASHAALRG